MEFFGHTPLLVMLEKGKQERALALCLLAMGGCQKCTVCALSLGRRGTLLTLDMFRVAFGTPPIHTIGELRTPNLLVLGNNIIEGRKKSINSGTCRAVVWIGVVSAVSAGFCTAAITGLPSAFSVVSTRESVLMI